MEKMNQDTFNEWMDLDQSDYESIKHYLERKCYFTNTCEMKEDNNLVINCTIFQNMIKNILNKQGD